MTGPRLMVSFSGSGDPIRGRSAVGRDSQSRFAADGAPAAPPGSNSRLPVAVAP